MARKGVGERRKRIMLGIDVSKDTLACSLVDFDRNLVWHATVKNAPEGVATLLEKIPADTPWIMEPTGRYSQTVARMAMEAGRDVRLASTRKAKQFLQAIQSRAKTDPLDSRGLAHFAYATKLPVYPLKEPALDNVDQLLSARRGVAKSIANLTLQQKSLPEAAHVIALCISDLNKRLKELDNEIEAKSESSPLLAKAALLDAVPGIGPITAATVCSRLSSKQFVHPDQFVAYAGLDIAVRQSGKRSGQNGLTKQGDAELRRLLYCAAQANIRCKSSPFKDQYYRERAKGLSSTAALVAVARKLAKVCWSMHKHGLEYDASRVNRAPKPSSTDAPSSSEYIEKEERAARGAGAASAPRRSTSDK
jgi:transposase